MASDLGFLQRPLWRRALAVSVALVATAMASCAPANPGNISDRLPQFAISEARRAEISAYLATERATRCSAAVNYLSLSFSSIEAQEFARRDYLEQCTDIVTEAELPEELHPLLKGVVTFVHSDPVTRYSGGRCHGFLNGDVLITARHCFQRSSSSATSIRLRPTIVVTRLTGEQSEIRPVSNKIEFEAAFDYHNDAIAIPLHHDDAAPNPEIEVARIADVTPGAQLILLAQHPYQDEATDGAPRQFMLDQTPICMVFRVSGTFLTHACQTDHSLSGAPIFERTNSGIRLVAVHAGFARALVNVERDLAWEALDVPNYGVALGL